MGGRGAIHTYEQRAKDDQHMPKEAIMEYQQSPPIIELLPIHPRQVQNQLRNSSLISLILLFHLHSASSILVLSSFLPTWRHIIFNLCRMQHLGQWIYRQMLIDKGIIGAYKVDGETFGTKFHDSCDSFTPKAITTMSWE